MPTFSGLQIPPPKNWQDFESLCCDVWCELWNDPNTQKNGRQGQAQNGVDVYGKPNQGQDWSGVQCKGKDNFADQRVTEDELKEEVKKAKNFKPRITEFILATTGPRDAQLQELARKITNRHRKRKFVVSVWAWDDIVEVIGKFPAVIAKHYPEFAQTTLLQQSFDRIEETKQAILEQGAKNIELISSDVDRAIAQSSGMSSLLAGSISELLTPQHEATLDYARQLIEDNKPGEAIAYLESQRAIVLAHASDNLKAQFINCTGVAQLRLGRERDAATSFFNARQHDDQDEKILCNCAIGHLLLGQHDDARTTAEVVLERNPASRRAQLALIHASTDKSLHEIIESLPSDLLENHEIAFALGVAAEERESLDESVKWFRLSVDQDETPSPDTKAALAHAILGRLLRLEGSALRIGQPTAEERGSLEEARSLLDDALGSFQEAELRRARNYCLVNRGLARRLLNDNEGAAADLDEALSVEPDLQVALFQRALVAEEMGDKDQAMELVNSITDFTDIPFAPLYKAELIAQRDGADAAAAEISAFLATSPPKHLVHTAKRLLAHVYLAEQRYDTARKLSDEVIAVNPSHVIDLVEAAHIRRGEGHPEEADALLAKARRCVTENTPPTHALVLADAFYELEKYADAASVYDKIVDPTTDQPNTRRLLRSCYEGDKLDRALEICEELRKANGPLQYAAEMEAAIYEDIGDLPKAEAVCQTYLENFPGDGVMRVRLAVTHLRSDQLGKVDEFLADQPSHRDLPTACGIQIANLLAFRGRHRDATELLYEIRRAHEDDGNLHLRYIQSIFLGGHGDKRWLGADVVDNDVAVCIEDVSGTRTSYIIDDRDDADISRNELQPTHVLAKRLLGKKTGDEIALKEDSTGATHGKIIEIKSKYLHACHESAAILEVKFPHVKGFAAFQFPKGEEGARLAAEAVLEEISNSTDARQSAIDLYLSGKTTLGHLAQLVGVNIVDTWVGLTSRPNRSVRCCLGTEDERQDAVNLLANGNPRLIVDIVSLMTIHSAGIADDIVMKYGKLGVAQATLDVLSEILHERRLVNPDGYESLVKEKDHFVRHKITAEYVKDTIEHLERLIEWIRTQCDVLPVTEAWRLERNYVRERGKLLGEENVDTVLIAKQPGHLLLSDDLLLRAIAKTELDVDGIWTQGLLLHALQKLDLDRSTYDVAVVSLIGLGYRHITVDSDLLLNAAEKSDWLPNEPFLSVVERLNGEECNDDTAIGVAVNFLLGLSDQSIMAFRQDALVFELLNSLVEGRRFVPTIRRLVGAVQERFRLNPLAANDYVATIAAWQSQRIV